MRKILGEVAGEKANRAKADFSFPCPFSQVALRTQWPGLQEPGFPPSALENTVRLIFSSLLWDATAIAF